MSTLSPPKRPRLSLQIKSLTTGPGIRTSRTLAAVTNPRSPTSFNTLTNVYSTAIDRSAVTPVPITAEPITAINMNDKRLPDLPRLQMPSTLTGDRGARTPFMATQLPETPLTAKPMSPAVAMEMRFPSTMTSTPPLSAGPLDVSMGQKQVFCFSPDDIQRHNQFYGSGDLNIVVTSDDCRDANANGDNMDTANMDSCSESSFATSDCGIDTPFPSDLHSSPPPPRPSQMSMTATTPITAISRRRATVPGLMIPSKPAPYIRNRALHSILRNSPLPPNTAATPISPRRQSQRLIDKANRHVMYNNPLTQTITTNLYTRSHVDLLCEEASPFASPSSASPSGNDAERVLDLTLAYTGNETRDGGTTPGPFEEMRRRMAGLGTHSACSSTATTPISPGSGLASPRSSGGIRKKKQAKKERKRRWVWTLGQDEEEEATLSGAMIALKAAQKAEEEAAAAADAAEATETVESAAAAADMEAELKTPLATVQLAHALMPAYNAVLPAVSECSSQEVEMQDSDCSYEGSSASLEDFVSASASTATTGSESESAEREAVKSTDTNAASSTKARKRKSTPTPYATDSESDFGGEEEADFDMDMQTPTTAHLQGAWFRQAAASAGSHSRLRNNF
ncbi:glucan 4-alpha-glucosidase [Ophiostoma piceae UAMH 11346]|uniref:Glucan 4-alpha-glucosidase n=1 Tax=Ophiostoma piceae (strain UAMH 11346) TaxID=1262450 RepID=S3C2N9_OPHP1|nr:glucan 4-alpha-glucosidase [Ophiostoma piceae UAMH 11346]